MINSTINYTIFSLCGFFQGLISQYALPILDKQSIWVTNRLISIPYIDTQDVAKFTIFSLSITNMNRKIFPLIGSKHWSSNEIIGLCEKLSGQRAITTTIPTQLLNISCNLTQLFQWSWKISERLSFHKILHKGQEYDKDYLEIQNTYLELGINFHDITSLEDYLQEYFYRMMKKLKILNSQVIQNHISIKF